MSISIEEQNTSSSVKDLLSQYNNPSKSIQKSAEENLLSLKNSIGLGQTVITLLNSSNDKSFQPILKSTALTITLQIIEKDNLKQWLDISNDHKEKLKHLCIQFFQVEKDPLLKPKYYDLLKQVTTYIVKAQETWPELNKMILRLYTILPMITSCSSSSILIDITFLLDVISTHYDYFYNDIKEHYHDIINFIREIYKTDYRELKMLSSQMIASIMNSSMGYSEESAMIGDLTLCVYRFFEECFLGNYVNDSLKVMIIIGRITKVNCEPFYGLFNELLVYVGKIINKKYKESEGIKEIALEVIMNIVDSQPELFINDVKGFMEYANDLLLYSFTIEHNIPDEWINTSVLTYNDAYIITEEQLLFIMQIINRLISKLGLLNCTTIFCSSIGKYLMQKQSKDFIEQYTCLILLSHLLQEADNTSMEAYNDLFPFIHALLSTKHSKVRLAIAHLIEQSSEAFSPEYSKKFLKELIPSLCTLSFDETIPIIQCKIVISIMTLMLTIEDKSHLRKSNKEVVHMLLGVLNNPNTHIMTRNEILYYLYELIEKLDEDFKPYAEQSFNVSMQLFANEYQQKTSRSLYSKMIMVIVAIGRFQKEKGAFEEIVPDLLQAIIDIITTVKDDMTVNELVICLEKLMPVIVEKRPELLKKVFDGIVMLLRKQSSQLVTDKAKPNAKGIYYRRQKSRSIQQLPSQEDIIQTIDLVNLFIDSLDSKFSPFALQLEHELTMILQETRDSEITKAVLHTMTHLISLLPKDDNRHKKSKEFTTLMFAYVKKEENPKKLHQYIAAIASLIQTGGMYLNRHEAVKLIEKLKEMFHEYHMKREEIISLSTSRDDNHREITEASFSKDVETIEMIQKEIIDIMTVMLKIYKSISNEFVNVIIEKFIPLYINDNSYSKRLTIFIINDCIEYLGEAHFPKDTWNSLFTFLIDSSSSTNEEIRRATCYGIGIFARMTSNDSFEKYSSLAIKSLFLAHSLQMNMERQREFYYAKDSISAAIGKILKYHPNSSYIKKNMMGIVSVWFGNLPIQFDKSEMEEQHELLCNMLLTNKDELKLKGVIKDHIVKSLSMVYKSKMSTEPIDSKIDHLFDLFKADKEITCFYSDLLKRESDNDLKKNMKLLFR